MSKIINDKYYTPPEIASFCVNKVKEIIGEDNITEYIEPSAGEGVFLNYLNKPYLAYDIDPKDSRIKEADYLSVDLEYKKGRCVIGNPPFGEGNSLSVRFYKKSIDICDYIAFIQPISQWDNNQQMYEFDLIYSEDLQVQKYSDIKIHCCFNIYKRPATNIFNKKKDYTLKDITIKEYRRGRKYLYSDFDYDIGICAFGKGSIGKIPKYLGEFSKEFYFKINNDKYKEEIIDLIKNTNWTQIHKTGSGQVTLPHWRIYKYLKEKIPELE